MNPMKSTVSVALPMLVFCGTLPVLADQACTAMAFNHATDATLDLVLPKDATKIAPTIQGRQLNAAQPYPWGSCPAVAPFGFCQRPVPDLATVSRDEHITPEEKHYIGFRIKNGDDATPKEVQLCVSFTAPTGASVSTEGHVTIHTFQGVKPAVKTTKQPK